MLDNYDALSILGIPISGRPSANQTFKLVGGVWTFVDLVSGSGDVGGGSGLTTAGAGVYVSSSSTLAQDASWTRVAAGQYTLYNATGPNTLIVRAGSAQSSTSVQQWLNNAGSAVATVSPSGVFTVAQVLLSSKQNLNTASLALASDVPVTFQNGTSIFVGSPDLGLARSPSIANTLLITNGSSTNYWGIGAGGIQCLSGDGNSAACDAGTTGARLRNVNMTGNLTIGGSIGGATGVATTGSFLAGATGLYYWTGRSVIQSPANGNIQISNQLATDFGLLQFGGATSSYNAIGRDAVNGFTIQSAAGTSTYNDASTSASGTVANRYLFGIAAPTLTSTNSSTTNTIASTLYIGGAPTASTNVTIGTALALYIAGGNSQFRGSVGIGPSNSSPSGTLHVYDATASTGVTRSIARAGAGQSTTNVFEVQNSSGTAVFTVNSSGAIFATSTANFGATSVTGTLTVSGNATASNFKRGAGSPEGSVSGSVGDIYLRTDGGAGTTMYVKESGTGNTGWAAK